MAFGEGWPRRGEVLQAINKVAHLIDSIALDARSLRGLSKIVGTLIVFIALADRLKLENPRRDFVVSGMETVSLDPGRRNLDARCITTIPRISWGGAMEQAWRQRGTPAIALACYVPGGHALNLLVSQKHGGQMND
jgi:hypothetical protein